MTAPKRILITGSRDFSDTELAAQALEGALTTLCPSDGGFTLVHGDAAGADRVVADVTAERFTDITIEAHPADWSQHTEQCPGWDLAKDYCSLAGFRRNAAMLDSGTQLCLAFPLHSVNAQGKGTSRGTWDMATRARNAGVPTFIVWRDALFAYGDPAEAIFDRETTPVRPSRRNPDGSIPLSHLILPF